MASKKERILEIEDYLKELYPVADAGYGWSHSEIQELEAELKNLKGTTRKKRGGKVGMSKKQSGHNRLY